MNKLIKLLLPALCIITLITSCGPKDPDQNNGEELITTVEWTLSPDGGGDDIIMTFTDLDGDGGDAPVKTEENLTANTTYTTSIRFLNEAETPTEDITIEVGEEDDEHQVFYQGTGGIVVTYTDMDGNGNPLGLSTSLTTSDTGSGSMKITLKHKPLKDEPGVSSGDITNAGGDTDVEVTFNFEIN